MRLRFEAAATEAADRVQERLRQHMSLLVATKAFFVARHGNVAREEYREFISALELDKRYNGIRGIGFARLLPTGREALAENEVARNYDIERPVWPETDAALRTPIVLLEPDDLRNHQALGYDMFSEGRRRAAMQAALRDDTLRASAPVELVQEITTRKQAGFLVYLPFHGRALGEAGQAAAAGPVAAEGARDVTGFVYAPFRAADFHVAALERRPSLPIAVETYDTTDGDRQFLFRSEDFETALASNPMSVARTFDVAGRQWTMIAHETAAFRDGTSRLYTFGVGTVSVLLVLALIMSTRAQMRELESVRRLQAVSEKAVQDKDLMLQEMRHRIKNSLARVMAIARRTAAGADGLDDFIESYSARLNAMANAQDMLTRSHWQRADLGELLSKELEQVFGSDLESCSLHGPKLSIDEKTTQALSLTFHELATNALKYGQLAEDGGALEVRWQVRETAGASELLIDWRETATVAVSEPASTGFGVRLIDANIRGELGGEIERSFDPRGMTLRLTVPIRKGG